MRMLMKVSMAVQASNRALKDGTLPKIVDAFVEQMKPEACYFTAEGGKRTAFFFFDLKDPTMIPSAAEPFFEHLDAEIAMSPVMSLEDMKTGVQRAMKR